MSCVTAHVHNDAMDRGRKDLRRPGIFTMSLTLTQKRGGLMWERPLWRVVEDRGTSRITAVKISRGQRLRLRLLGCWAYWADSSKGREALPCGLAGFS